MKRIQTKNREINENFVLADTELTRKKQQYESIALSNQMPIEWHRAKNFNVFDRQGNKWIDMTAGIFVANAGHSNPKIVEAINKQADQMMFSFLYNNQIRYKFIERLLEISPSYYEKAVLLNSGSEVTDIASKLIKFWAKKNNRKHIVTFRGSYHGRTLGADFLCGNENSTEWSNMEDDDMIFLDFPYRQDDVFDPTELGDPKNIAAFFLETYQGWGAWMYPQEYLRQLYEFARKNGILICFDEIQAGFYRMGTLYGYMSYGDYIEPDLICLGKGISSSLPMAAILGTKELIDIDEKAVVGGTHSGNAVCCAASLANIDFLTDEAQGAMGEKNKLFEKRSLDLLKCETVTNINTRGMVTGIIFDNTEAATTAVKRCISNGVLPVCTFRNAIKLGPPLTITIEALEEAFDVIEDAIKRT
jgi:4-aminobutyrate aminotransferase/(S)-3-amino-2-methylpropionate transaminase